MNNFIPVNTPLLTGGNEKKYVNECIDSGWISSEGPFVERFEKEFAESVGRKYGVAVTNGSSALDAAALAIGLKEGDEVIMPTFTIISCASAIIRSGATPVFVDCDELTFNIKTEDIEPLINKNTKAIMVVHIYGLPCDMDEIEGIAKKHNLKIIEDSAEMHGQKYKERSCGSFGDVSTFSFYPNKHITTGEGGMIVTDCEEIASKCKKLRNLYFEPPDRFIHQSLGYNFRMTNIQAALGVAQLEKIQKHIEIKRQIGQMYNEYLGDQENIQLPVRKSQYAENIYWVYSIVLQTKKGLTAKEVMVLLGENDIGSRPFFYPMHLQPVLKRLGYKNNAQNCSTAEKIYKFGLYLPSGLGLQGKDIERVSNVLKEIINE